MASNKRQRTAEQSLNISNLPDGILAHAASYLAKPSRALFVVALTAREQDNFSIGSKHQQTVASILQSEQCSVLDFGDIEKSLALKLTDDDIHAVLKCISAQDVLKKLKLTGCLDLSQLDPKPMISEEVIPILESIVSEENNSLKMIVFSI